MGAGSSITGTAPKKKDLLELLGPCKLLDSQTLCHHIQTQASCLHLLLLLLSFFAATNITEQSSGSVTLKTSFLSLAAAKHAQMAHLDKRLHPPLDSLSLIQLWMTRPAAIISFDSSFFLQAAQGKKLCANELRSQRITASTHIFCCGNFGRRPAFIGGEQSNQASDKAGQADLGLFNLQHHTRHQVTSVHMKPSWKGAQGDFCM